MKKDEIVYSNGDYCVSVGSHNTFGFYYAWTCAIKGKTNPEGVFRGCFEFELDGKKTKWYNPLSWFKKDDPCTAIQKTVDYADILQKQELSQKDQDKRVQAFVNNWKQHCA